MGNEMSSWLLNHIRCDIICAPAQCAAKNSSGCSECNQIVFQSKRLHNCQVLFLRAMHMPATCNHSGAPTLRRKATTSLWLYFMAFWRAVPSLQASGWLWFNENREQHWQRPHLSLAAKSAFDETRSLQTSTWPFMAERINGVSPLGEKMELLAKMRNEK